jgi:hypothetical protein
MSLIIAAIRSGTDPIAPLPPASFHRWLEDPIYCPKCEATYMLVTGYDDAVSRHFEDESRRHISLLRKAVMLGHSHGHRVTHFETNGVAVIRHVPEAKAEPAPMPKHIM